jgi:hypothetical protein
MNEKMPEQNNDELVGPRSDQRSERKSIIDLQSTDGQPLWMAFIDEDALTIEAHEVEQAKNKLNEIAHTHPEKLEECAEQTLDMCRRSLQENLDMAA